MTIDQLIKELKLLQKKNKGKDIVLSRDEEGNGFSYLFSVEVHKDKIILWPGEPVRDNDFWG